MSQTQTEHVPLEAIASINPKSSTEEKHIDHHNQQANALGTQTPQDVETPPSSTPGTPPNEPSAGQDFSELPPVDRGKGAYMFLVCCFTIEALVWGFPFSFGIFQDHYRMDPNFADSGNIAVIGTCAMGIMYIGAPVFLTLHRLYPRLFLWAPLTGILIMCLALGLSSLSTTTTHLIITQGILYAIGGGICYFPCIIYTDEWFVRRKGLAYGVMWSATGFGGVVIPLVMQWSLDSYGYKTTLRAWSVALFLLTIPLVPFTKPRIPPPRRGHLNKKSFTVVWDPVFVMYQVTAMVQALGFFLPGVYLPTFARTTLDAGPWPAALTVILVNIASVFGCIVMGLLTDRYHAATCMIIASVGAAVSVLVLWGLSVNLGVLYTFCICYGLFAGSYTSAWSGVMKQMNTRSDEKSRARGESTTGGSTFDPTAVLGFLAAGRGVGNIVSGPLSEALISKPVWEGEAFGAYGSGYGILVAFTGVTALLGGAAIVWKQAGWM